MRAKEILSYFLRHPQAADSLEGVARWRLREELIRHGVEEVGRALQWLVLQGFVRERCRLGAGPIFSLNHESVAEAAHFMGVAAEEERPTRAGGHVLPTSREE